MISPPYEVSSRTGEYSRKVWVVQGEGPVRRLCLFLDAELYLERVGAPALILEHPFQGIGFVFVSHSSGEARHYDYICNPRYAEFISQDVVGWASEKMSVGREGHALCGLSLSGLQSAFISLLCPFIFPDVVCQSGSFWWNREWLTDQVPGLTAHPGRFWLSVGDREKGAGDVHATTGLRQEVDQGEAVERMGTALRSAGHDVHRWRP